MADQEWALLEPLLPQVQPQRGGRWRDHRQVVEGMVFKERTSCPWRELPE
ncbi:transposase [Actinopolyspora erythraea]|nr:transposase [Actinopolyspora erythraea]